MRAAVSWACIVGVLCMHAPRAYAAASDDWAPSETYLRAEASLWTGAHLYKEGREVGPGFAALDLALAVHGVPVAEWHAHRTKVAAIASLAFAAASLTLTAASIAYHFEHADHGNSWPLLGYGDAVQFGINIGWLTSLACGIVARRIYHNELLATVSEYNYALLRSVESQFE